MIPLAARPPGPPVCPCVSDHRPAIVGLPEIHHIWPVGMGGPDEPGNVTYLCQSGHDAVHDILRVILRSGPLTYAAARTRWPGLNHHAWAIAHEGLHRFHENAHRPGTP